MSIMLKTPALSDEAKKALIDKLVAAVRAGRITLETIASITKDDDFSMETLEQDISYLGAGLINECLVVAGEPAPNDPQLDPLEAMIERLEMYARTAQQYAATPAQIKLLSRLAVEAGEKAEGVIAHGELTKGQASFMINFLKSEA